MPAASPRYVLSERAANALRELIAPGSAYGARKRPAHDAQTVDLRELFRVRRVGNNLQIHLISSDAVSLAVRINGRATVADIDDQALDNGWMDLGPAAAIGAVWIRPGLPETPSSAAATAAEMTTNWDARAVIVRIVTTTTTDPPAAPPWTPSGLEFDRYLHPVPVWARIDTMGYQLHVGVVEMSVEISDDDGTHSGDGSAFGYPAAGGFRSIVQYGGRSLGLSDFREPSLLTPIEATAAGGPQIILRVPGWTGSDPCAKLGYVVFAEVVDMLRQQVGTDLLQWLSQPGNLDTLAGILADEFNSDGLWWIRGGDELTCYGSGIGNSQAAQMIDLDYRRLVDQWTAAGNFTVGDANNSADLAVNGNIDGTGHAYVDGDISAACSNGETNHLGGDLDMTNHDIRDVGNLTASGDISAVGNVSGTNLTASGALEGATLKLGANTFAPRQITYLDANNTPQTITVLEKQ